MSSYDHKTIEEKWVAEWIDKKTYSPDLAKAKKPYYNLMMFPYPSAEGLHVGNMYAFTGADVFGRYQRMKGYDVFEPIGLDGFGIHSENYAIKMGKHPVEMAKISQERFYKQLSRIGNGFAWDHRLETYDPDYYKWTQWLFTEMFRRGLAYRKSASVNWCPSCKTVLADEQVEDGKCERCKSEVGRKEMKQWFFRITKYADRLLANIEKIDWPEKIKIAQRNWIGKKEGIEISYPVVRSPESGVEITKVTCFTTRPDTNFGATFIVLAPEHELVEQILSGVIKVPENTKKEIQSYVKKALKKTEQQRKVEEKKKTGVFLNLYAINRLNDLKIPIYVSDFVLKDFGTGAVVGVPGHDVRDFEFAKEFDLPVIRVVEKEGDTSEIVNVEQVFEDQGVMVHSQFLNGMDIHQATTTMMDYLEEKSWGKRVTSYHLRDWLISRQRYWGPPIPMLYCEACAKIGKGDQTEMAGWYAVSDDQLPVTLPNLDNYQPTGDGKAPLENAGDDFLYTKCPHCGGQAKRETDVSDTFLDSSWYFLAYPIWKSGKGPSTGSGQSIFDNKILEDWLPVTTYIGGAEHAVLHLLYSRFVWMALQDWGYIPAKLGDEPFPFLFSHGLIVKDGAKMSKSRGNVVVPDEYIEKFGSDTLRMYLMFLGSYDQGGDFRDSGIAGMYRFLNKIWEMLSDESKVLRPSGFSRKSRSAQDDKLDLKSVSSLSSTIGCTTSKLESKLHETIRKMDRDIAAFKYNTAISALMELINVWRDPSTGSTGSRQAGSGQGPVEMSLEDARLVVKLLAPFAPCMTEELWQMMRGDKAKSGKKSALESVHLESYPTFNESKIQSAGLLVIVQVNGKKRGEIVVQADQAQDEKAIIASAKQTEGVEKWIVGGIRKEIFVPAKGERQGIVNFVVLTEKA